MTYLGSFFFEDFRYHSISTILREKILGHDDRIDRARARAAFIRIGDRFIGKGLGLYITDLQQFCDAFPPERYDGNPDILLDSPISCHGTRSYGLEPMQRLAFHNEAQTAVRHLGLRDARAHDVCLALGYWLGFGFYKDPLFPWVRVKAQMGGTTALFAYAQQRLSVQFRILAKSHG